MVVTSSYWCVFNINHHSGVDLNFSSTLREMKQSLLMTRASLIGKGQSIGVHKYWEGCADTSQDRVEFCLMIYLFGPNWNHSGSLSTSPDQTNQGSNRLGGTRSWDFQTVKPKPHSHIFIMPLGFMSVMGELIQRNKYGIKSLTKLKSYGNMNTAKRHQRAGLIGAI